MDAKVLLKNERNVLKSVLGISQYLIRIKNDLRLITILGEAHQVEFDCKSHAISVKDYTLNILNQGNSLVLLEIDPKLIKRKDKWPCSKPIKEILKSTKSTKNIIGYDWRNTLMGNGNIEKGRKLQDNLYWPCSQKNCTKIVKNPKDSYLNTLSSSEVIEWYIIPLEKALKNDSILQKSDFEASDLQFLKDYRQSLLNDTKKLKENFKRKWNSHKRETKEETKEELRNLWVKVTDWNILKHIYEYRSDVDTILIITGESHRKNLDKKLLKRFQQEVRSGFLKHKENINIIEISNNMSFQNCVHYFEWYKINQINK
tara:strand:+ start:319 stop:1263 length:945 start_codon:yes stop_codon:yes gene_type:complete